MATKRKRIIRLALIVVAAGLIIGAGVGLYLYNLPHRDVQGTATDFQITSSGLVNEYINDWDAANSKYLAADGNSKILEVTGTVSRVNENFNGQKVVLLKESGDKAGVSFSFSKETSPNAEGIQSGDQVTIKGVIRSGVYFDKDLDMYIHAVVDESDLVKHDQ